MACGAHSKIQNNMPNNKVINMLLVLLFCFFFFFLVIQTVTLVQINKMSDDNGLRESKRSVGVVRENES